MLTAYILKVSNDFSSFGLELDMKIPLIVSVKYIELVVVQQSEVLL